MKMTACPSENTLQENTILHKVININSLKSGAQLYSHEYPEKRNFVETGEKK